MSTSYCIRGPSFRVSATKDDEIFELISYLFLNLET